jgi:hypothetical protein
MQVTVVYLKVRTIDSWSHGLAEGGTASALSNMGLPYVVVDPLFAGLRVLSSSFSSRESAPAAAHVDAINTFFFKSSMRQFHRRHSICQTLFTTHVLSVPGSSYRLCTVLWAAQSGKVNGTSGCSNALSSRQARLLFVSSCDKDDSFPATLHHAETIDSVLYSRAVFVSRIPLTFNCKIVMDPTPSATVEVGRTMCQPRNRRARRCNCIVSVVTMQNHPVC